MLSGEVELPAEHPPHQLEQQRQQMEAAKLEAERLRQETEQMKEKSEAYYAEIKREREKAVRAARAEAQSIIDDARRTANEVYELFHREFLNISEPYALSRAKFYEEAIAGSAANVTHFSGVLSVRGQFVQLESRGNGPIDAVKRGLEEELGISIKVLDYSEHALTSGSGAQAASYIHLMDQKTGKVTYGVGISSNITRASIRGIFSAVNRLFY